MACAFTAREQTQTAQWDAWITAVDPWPWTTASGAPRPADPDDGLLIPLLDPREQIVRFRYRRRAVDNLITWCHETEASPVHLLVGAAGVGKTRVAAQLTRELTETTSEWTVGAAFPDQPPPPYALRSSCPAAFWSWSAMPTAAMTSPRPCRHCWHTRTPMLLIARSGQHEQWWLTVRRAVAAAARPQALRATGQTVLGPVVHTRADQEQLFVQAMDAFAYRLGVRTPTIGMQQLDPGAPILMIHAAALVALLRARRGRTAAVIDVDATVWEELFDHEAAVWQAAADHLGVGLLPDTQRDVVACAALLGGPDEDAVVDWLVRIPDLTHADRQHRHRVAEWLHILYPAAPSSWLAPVEPALLADQLVIALCEKHPALAEAVLVGLRPGMVAGVVVLLGRLIPRWSWAATHLDRVLREQPELAIPIACRVVSTSVQVDRWIAVCIDDPAVTVSAEWVQTLWDGLPRPEETTLLAWAVLALARRRVILAIDDIDRARWWCDVAEAFLAVEDASLRSGPWISVWEAETPRMCWHGHWFAAHEPSAVPVCCRGRWPRPSTVWHSAAPWPVLRSRLTSDHSPAPDRARGRRVDRQSPRPSPDHPDRKRRPMAATCRRRSRRPPTTARRSATRPRGR